MRLETGFRPGEAKACGGGVADWATLLGSGVAEEVETA
jgi:hypothetical protein